MVRFHPRSQDNIKVQYLDIDINSSIIKSMKNIKLVSEKLLSKSVVRENKKSLNSFREYRKAIKVLDKIRFPFGKQAIYEPVGANTTGTITTDFYGYTTG